MTDSEVSTRPTARGRYAPSPTGHPTVGNAYTAIRAWLDVKSRDGVLVLRLDDTDTSRQNVTGEDVSQAVAELGLTWDEGYDIGGPYAPYVTSERSARHAEAAEKLLAQGAAYWDYSPPLEDAEAHRKTKGAERGRVGAYRGTGEPADGVDPVLRLKVPEDRGAITVHDRIFGTLNVATEDVGEVALQRSDGRPTYHLASCVDDADMGITTIVRGQDWLNFLPQHVLIFEALGVELPEFAHLPLLVGPDGQKLSKRAGDLSIDHIVHDEGIPAAALCAYLANLGFPERPDLLSLDELAGDFDLSAHNRNQPRFDPKKLRSFARRWLAEKEPEAQLAAQIRRRAPDVEIDDTTMDVLVPGIRPRIGSYEEAATLVRFLALDDVAGRDPAALDDALARAILATDPWETDALESTVNEAFAVFEDDRRARLAAMRDALAPGQRVTPPLHYMLAALGPERSAARLALRTETE